MIIDGEVVVEEDEEEDGDGEREVRFDEAEARQREGKVVSVGENAVCLEGTCEWVVGPRTGQVPCGQLQCPLRALLMLDGALALPRYSAPVESIVGWSEKGKGLARKNNGDEDEEVIDCCWYGGTIGQLDHRQSGYTHGQGN